MEKIGNIILVAYQQPPHQPYSYRPSRHKLSNRDMPYNRLGRSVVRFQPDRLWQPYLGRGSG